MNYILSKVFSDGFAMEISENTNYYNSNKEVKSIEFNISEFEKEISYEDFRIYFYKKIDPSFNSEKGYCGNELEDLVKCLYGYYFIKTESTFKTGESLTINIPFKECPIEKIYQINLMLKNYPVIWNEIKSFNYKNTDYQLFISEISKASNDLWKVELIMTKKESARYFLGGRFKFFIKAGDIINLKYYEHPLYNIDAEVISIDYNSITLKFSGVSKPSEIHNISERW